MKVSVHLTELVKKSMEPHVQAILQALHTSQGCGQEWRSEINPELGILRAQPLPPKLEPELDLLTVDANAFCVREEDRKIVSYSSDGQDYAVISGNPTRGRVELSLSALLPLTVPNSFRSPFQGEAAEGFLCEAQLYRKNSDESFFLITTKNGELLIRRSGLQKAFMPHHALIGLGEPHDCWVHLTVSAMRTLIEEDSGILGLWQAYSATDKQSRKWFILESDCEFTADLHPEYIVEEKEVNPRLLNVLAPPYQCVWTAKLDDDIRVSVPLFLQ